MHSGITPYNSPITNWSFLYELEKPAFDKLTFVHTVWMPEQSECTYPAWPKTDEGLVTSHPPLKSPLVSAPFFPSPADAMFTHTMYRCVVRIGRYLITLFKVWFLKVLILSPVHLHMTLFMLLTFVFQILLVFINNKKLLLLGPIINFHEMTQALQVYWSHSRLTNLLNCFGLDPSTKGEITFLSYLVFFLYGRSSSM